MKIKVILTIIVVCLTNILKAQVAINSDGSAPDNSSMLDVKSSTKGILVPRMTIAQRGAIVSPATGLLIFCTDNNQYYTNKGTPSAPNWLIISSQWMTSGNNISYSGGNVGINTNNPVLRLQVNGRIGAEYGNSTTPAYTFSDGAENTGFSSPAYQTLSMTTGGVERVRITESGTIGVGTSAVASSAIVDITSTTRGFIPPRMTTAQRNAIVSPVEGLVIYNTDDNALNLYSGTSWGFSVPWSCGQPFTDTRNGKIYNTIQIGFQCWMKENLNIGTLINGTLDQTNNGNIEKYCQNDLESNCNIYGGLYQWGEAMNYTPNNWNNPGLIYGDQGICPSGWHVPSDWEWNWMKELLGGEEVAGGKMKEFGTTHWSMGNSDATNQSHFTGLPGGVRGGCSGSAFCLFPTYGLFWTATENFFMQNYAFANELIYSGKNLYRNPEGKLKWMGHSIRCMKDN